MSRLRRKLNPFKPLVPIKPTAEVERADSRCPTLEEIRERCAEIHAEWSAEETIKRAGRRGVDDGWLPPLVRTRGLVALESVGQSD